MDKSVGIGGIKMEFGQYLSAQHTDKGPKGQSFLGVQEDFHSALSIHSMRDAAYIALRSGV